MRQSEVEDFGVRGDRFFRGEGGAVPCLGLKEDGAVGIAEGWVRGGGGLESREGGGSEGADVVGWHHCFGIFAVCEGSVGWTHGDGPRRGGLTNG